MKTKAVLVALISAAAFVMGCHKQETISQQLDQVEAKTKKAVQNLKDYSFSEKNEFIFAVQNQLTNLNQNVSQLSAKIDSASASIQIEAKPKMQSLRDKFSILNQRLADTQNASEATWDRLKADTQEAYDAVEQGVRDSRQWVSEKIAP
jgi:cytochrome c556